MRTLRCAGLDQPHALVLKTADGSKSKPASSKPDKAGKAVGEHDIKSEKVYTVEDESTLVFNYAPKDILQQNPVTHDIVLVEEWDIVYVEDWDTIWYNSFSCMHTNGLRKHPNNACNYLCMPGFLFGDIPYLHPVHHPSWGTSSSSELEETGDLNERVAEEEQLTQDECVSIWALNWDSMIQPSISKLNGV